MTRKMLKEEKELRKYVLGPEHPMNASVIRSMIAALIRAVREDSAKVAEAAHEHRVTTMIVFHEYLSDLSQKDLDKIIDTDKKLQAALNSRRAKEG